MFKQAMITGFVAALALFPALADATNDDKHGGRSDRGNSSRSDDDRGKGHDDRGKGHKDDDKGGRGHGGSIPGGIGGGGNGNGGHGGGGGPTAQAGEPIALLIIGAGLLGAAALRRRQ